MARKTDQDKRVQALATSRYFRTIVESVIGHPPDTLIAMRDGSLSDERKLVVTLSIDDARRIADALNREAGV